MHDVKTNSVFLKSIESSIDRIQRMGKMESESREVLMELESIKKMIKMEFKELNCEKIYITQNKMPAYFFGICVFPTMSELDRIADALVSIDEKVKIIPPKNFLIEIDSKLLYDLGATPSEIVAGLLHELGHRVYFNEELVTLKYRIINKLLAYAEIISSLAFILKPLKWLLFNLILILGFSATIDHMLKLRDEIRADSLAMKYGYASPLKSLLEKISNASALFPIHNPNVEKENELMIQWSIKNMINFSIRRNEIEKFLTAQRKENNSPYVDQVIDLQLDKLKKTKGSRVIQTLTPENKKKAITESISTFFELRKKGSSDLELDEVRVELSRIEDNEDKLYVISRIYKDFDIANGILDSLYKNKLVNKDQIAEVERFKIELNKLLIAARNVKISNNNNLKIIIKNPQDDYEGKDYIVIT